MSSRRSSDDFPVGDYCCVCDEITGWFLTPISFDSKMNINWMMKCPKCGHVGCDKCAKRESDPEYMHNVREKMKKNKI